MSGRRPDRGMVTAETAFASLATVVLLVLGATGLTVVVTQVRLYDCAAEVARQVARGDHQAAAAARSRVPAGTRVDIDDAGGRTTVRASAEVRLPLVARPLPLTASVSVLTEPEP